MKTFKEITEAVKKAKATKNEIVFHGTEGTPQPQNKPVKEDVESIDEISDKTLSSYVDAARKDRERNKTDKASNDPAQKAYAHARDKKRMAGMNKAKSYLMPGTAGHAKNQARRAANEEVEVVDEKLTPAAGAGEYIKDFQASTNTEFAGKSKEKRRTMALAAYMQAKRKVSEEVENIEEATPYYNKPSFLKNMGRIAKQERLAREKKEAEAKQKPVKEEAESVDEGATGAKPGWMLRQDPALAKKLKDQQERKKFVAGEPSKQVKEEAELEEATKYVVHYTDSKGQHVNSSKAFDDKKKADAHADKGNKIDKVGGKYTVKPMQNEDIVNFDNEGNLMAEKKSYTEFMSQLLEYEVDKNGRYVHKGNYGSAYKDPEGADDADDKPKKAAGRKVGSKVGPKKNLGNSKLHTK